MASLIVEKIQVIEVKAGSKYFVMARVLAGYETDIEANADIIAEIKDAFVPLAFDILVSHEVVEWALVAIHNQVVAMLSRK